MPGSSDSTPITTPDLVSRPMGTLPWPYAVVFGVASFMLVYVGQMMVGRLDSLGSRLDQFGTRMGSLELRLAEQGSIAGRVEDNRAELRSMRADFEARLRALEKGK